MDIGRLVQVAACVSLMLAVVAWSGAVWGQAQKADGVRVVDAQGRGIQGVKIRSVTGEAFEASDGEGWVRGVTVWSGWHDVVAGERAFKVWGATWAGGGVRSRDWRRLVLPVGKCPEDGVEVGVRVTKADGSAAGGAWVCVRKVVRVDELADWSWLWMRTNQEGVAWIVMPRENQRLAGAKAGLGVLWLEMQAVTVGEGGLDTGWVHVAWNGGKDVELKFTGDEARRLEGVGGSDTGRVFQKLRRNANAGWLMPDPWQSAWWSFGEARQLPAGEYQVPRESGKTWIYQVEAEAGRVVKRLVNKAEGEKPREAKGGYVAQKAGTTRVRLSVRDRRGESVEGLQVKMSVPGKKWSALLTVGQEESVMDVPAGVKASEVVLEAVGDVSGVLDGGLLQRQVKEASKTAERWEVWLNIERWDAALSRLTPGRGKWRLADAAGRPMRGARVEIQGIQEKKWLGVDEEGVVIDAEKRLGFYPLWANVHREGMPVLRLGRMTLGGSLGEWVGLRQTGGDERDMGLVRLPVLLEEGAEKKAHFAGRVVGPDGMAAAGCQVWVNRAIRQPGRWDLADTWRGAGVVTDEEGRFKTWPVEPWSEVAGDEAQEARVKMEQMHAPEYPLPPRAVYGDRWLAVVKARPGSGLADAMVEMKVGALEEVTIRLEKAVKVRVADEPGVHRSVWGFESPMSLVRVDDGLKARMRLGVRGEGCCVTMDLAPGSYRLESTARNCERVAIDGSMREVVMAWKDEQHEVQVEVVEKTTGKPLAGAMVCADALASGGWTEGMWDALRRRDEAILTRVRVRKQDQVRVTDEKGVARMNRVMGEVRERELYVYAEGYVPMRCIVPEAERGGKVSLRFEMKEGGQVRVVWGEGKAQNEEEAHPVWGVKSGSLLWLETVGAQIKGDLHQCVGARLHIPGTIGNGGTVILPRGEEVMLAGYRPNWNSSGHMMMWGDYDFPLTSVITQGRAVEMGLLAAPVAAAGWDVQEVRLKPRATGGLHIRVVDGQGRAVDEARVRAKVRDAASGLPLADWGFVSQGWLKAMGATRVQLEVEWVGKVIGKPEWTFDVPAGLKDVGPVTLVVEGAVGRKGGAQYPGFGYVDADF